MNIAHQIASAAAAAHRAKPTGSVPPHPRLRNLLLGGPAQSAKAYTRYEAVMAGRGWITQRQIECALGYAASVSTAYLGKLLSLGVVERRNKGGAAVFSKRLGYEWRWK